MIPTLAQVADHCRRAYLGDTEVPGGGIWKDPALLGSTDGVATSPIAAAYSTLIQALKLTAHRLLRRTAHFVIPSYTRILQPAQIGQLIGAPIELHARPLTAWASDIDSLAMVAASGLDPASLDILFDSAHAFPEGAIVQLTGFRGITDSINDEWCVMIPTASSIRLRGCNFDPAAYTAGTGMVMYSTSPWPANAAKFVPELTLNTPPTSTTELVEWSFSGGQFYLPPLTQTLQGRLTYELSPICPVQISASVGVPGSLDFLACYAAAVATAAKGMTAAAARLYAQATGSPVGEIGHCNGGLLGQLTRPEVKSQQSTGDRIQLPRFRPKRNHGPVILY